MPLAMPSDPQSGDGVGGIHLVAQSVAVMRRPRGPPARRQAPVRLPPRRPAPAPQVELAPTLRRSVNALSSAVLARRAIALKLTGFALAVAVVALLHPQLGQHAEPVLETAHNETVVYRQPASRPTYVQAELSDLMTDDEDEAVPYFPRTVQTIRFVNPNSKEANRAPAPAGDSTRLASREVV